jgi:hypothetical protein
MFAELGASRLPEVAMAAVDDAFGLMEKAWFSRVDTM